MHDAARSQILIKITPGVETELYKNLGYASKAHAGGAVGENKRRPKISCYFPFNTSQNLIVQCYCRMNRLWYLLYIGIGLSVKTVVLHGGGVSVTWPRIMSAHWKQAWRGRA
jgi:hypothetical protein